MLILQLLRAQIIDYSKFQYVSWIKLLVVLFGTIVICDVTMK